MQKKLPLCIVSGSSGSGKSYVINELRKIMPEFDIFDIDALRELHITDHQLTQNICLGLHEIPQKADG